MLSFSRRRQSAMTTRHCHPYLSGAPKGVAIGGTPSKNPPWLLSSRPPYGHPLWGAADYLSARAQQIIADRQLRASLRAASAARGGAESSASDDTPWKLVPQGQDAMTPEEIRRVTDRAAFGASEDEGEAPDEGASVRKRPAAKSAPRKRPAAARQRPAAARKRPAAEVRGEAASVPSRPAQGAGSSAQENEDSHNGSYDEPPRDQPRNSGELLSRLASSGTAPFRGLL